MTEESNTPPSYGSEIGNVLWFDQKKGFGFIKIITPSSDFLDKEVFVHYSNITSVNTFKKLYPGENVSLNVIKNTATTAKCYIIDKKTNNVSQYFDISLQ